MNGKAHSRVRYNAEYFGFIVGMPDGEILLARPSAMSVLHDHVSRQALDGHLLARLEVVEPFHLATPPLVWLELTRKCNLSCPHCYIDAGKARASEMSTHRWHELIDELADMGVWAVAFTGGEPTLHRELAPLVRHARARDLLVGIATHGMFLSDSLLDSMPSDGVIISVSIDNLHVGKGKQTCEPTLGMQAVMRAQAHGFLTNVMTNTHRHNAGSLQALINWSRENGVSVRSVPFSPIGRGRRHSELENTVDHVEAAAQFWLKECEWEHEYHQKAGLCVGVIFNYGLSLAYMTRRCSSGRYLCYIASDGTIFPCTMCAAESLLSPGSVHERSFAELWRDDWEIRNYSWENFKSTCEGCPINSARYYCASRCPAMSYARHGRYFACGASQFEVQSTVRRTELLEATETGMQSNRPVEFS